MTSANLFSDIQSGGASNEEAAETLFESGGTRIERIISTGQASPPGFWYDQAEDEWVALLEGRAELEYDDRRREPLGRGDWVFIPAGRRHRVAYTDLYCVWLAVFVARGVK
jgi:cupin 2 domain-containing protein